MMLRPAPAAAGPALDPAVVWDDSPCPLCGRRDAAVVLDGRDPTPVTGPGLRFAVVKCRACDLCYTNPRPDEDSIAGFYPADYRPHRRPRKMQQVRAKPLSEKVFGRPCSERRGGLPWHGAGRLLDFGCGGGGFLRRMADQGWQVTGLDAAVGAVRRVQEELGLKAVVGTLPHPDLAPGSFDVVTMWHALEHVHDPLAVLRAAFQVLTPGGKLVVACPNMASWPARRFGPAWFGLDLPRHLTHFTPHTLTRTLTAAGFMVQSVKLVRHSDWLRSSAKLACREPNADVLSRALRWKPLAKAAAWLAFAAGASDCMVAVADRPG